MARKESSTTTEGITATLAGDHILIEIIEMEATIPEMNSLIKERIIIIPKKNIILPTLLEAILIKKMATVVIQAVRAIINVFHSSMAKLSVGTVHTVLSTFTLAGTFSMSIPKHHLDSTTLLAVLTTSARFTVRWRKNSVAPRDGRSLLYGLHQEREP